MGQSISDIRNSLLDKDLNDPLDISGYGEERAYAVNALGARLVGSVIHIDRMFFPNMLDEPDFRKRIKDLFFDRLLNGTNYAAHLDGIIDSGTSFISPHFDLEQSILVEQWIYLKNGLVVPGKSSATMERLVDMEARFTQFPTQAQGFDKQLKLPSGILMANKDWTHTIKSMDKIEEINARLTAKNGISVDTAKVKKVVADMQNKVNELGNPFTIAKAVEVFGVLQAAVEAKEIGPVESSLIQQLMTPEVSLYQSVIAELDGQVQQARAAQPDADTSALEADMAEFYEANKIPPLNVADGFDQRLKPLLEQVANMVPLSVDEIRELEAQRELLITIMKNY